jgi:hypothetical protein
MKHPIRQCGLLLSASIALVYCVIPCAQADPTPTINIRGTLVDSGGSPIHGTRAFEIRFFDAESGGNQLGGVSSGTVEVELDGVFNIPVIPSALVLSASLAWYSIGIDTDTPADGSAADDLFPLRIQLHSVPFALLAADSQKLGGQDAAAYATDSDVAGEFLPLSGGALIGPVTTNSTMDGRDLGADGAKLDGIEPDATADQTAHEIAELFRTTNESLDVGTGTLVSASLITDTIGINVGIASRPLHIRVYGVPAEDQANLVGANIFGNEVLWQTFRAGTTGRLESISFKNTDSESSFRTLSIYQGQGLGGQLLSSNTIFLGANNSLNGYPAAPNSESSPLVTSGVLYTWALTGGFTSLQNNPVNDIYPDGESSAGSAADFVFKTFVSTLQQGLALDPTGNLGLGTLSAGTQAQSVLSIGNGSAPVTSPANQVQIYAQDVSAKSELKVRDEVGNVTTLSPHNFTLAPKSEPMAWAFYSENNTVGKAINVDMLRTVRLVEKISGEKLVHIKDLGLPVESQPPAEATDADSSDNPEAVSLKDIVSEVRSLREENSALQGELEELRRRLNAEGE